MLKFKARWLWDRGALAEAYQRSCEVGDGTDKIRLTPTLHLHESAHD